MKKFFILAFMLSSLALKAQVDTTLLYVDREDTLSTAVATGTGPGNYLSKYP